jgi:hypothetical protein
MSGVNGYPVYSGSGSRCFRTSKNQPAHGRGAGFRANHFRIALIAATAPTTQLRLLAAGRIGNHESEASMGGGSDDVGGDTAAYCIRRKTSLWLLYAAQTRHHGWSSLLGVEGLSGWTMGMVMGIRRSGIVAQSVSASQDATYSMATNRSLARCPCNRLVWLLAYSEERGSLACRHTVESHIFGLKTAIRPWRSLLIMTTFSRMLFTTRRMMDAGVVCCAIS